MYSVVRYRIRKHSYPALFAYCSLMSEKSKSLRNASLFRVRQWFTAFNNKYSNDEEACYDFFWNAKHPEGFVCEKCGCTHYRRITRHRVTECKECGHQEYLFARTFFRDNKLPVSSRQ